MAIPAYMSATDWGVCTAWAAEAARAPCCCCCCCSCAEGAAAGAGFTAILVREARSRPGLLAKPASFPTWLSRCCTSYSTTEYVSGSEASDNMRHSMDLWSWKGTSCWDVCQEERR